MWSSWWRGTEPPGPAEGGSTWWPPLWWALGNHSSCSPKPLFIPSQHPKVLYMRLMASGHKKISVYSPLGQKGYQLLSRTTSYHFPQMLWDLFPQVVSYQIQLLHLLWLQKLSVSSQQTQQIKIFLPLPSSIPSGTYRSQGLALMLWPLASCNFRHKFLQLG